jgi:hypothetical protein
MFGLLSKTPIALMLLFDNCILLNIGHNIIALHVHISLNIFIRYTCKVPKLHCI